MALHGTGAYQGLAAYLAAIWPCDEVGSWTVMIRGLVIEDELPLFPEPSAE